MTGKGRALLIATDGYSDATFRQLRAPRADAEALAEVLADPAVGGYEVEALHDPPAHEANLAIEDLFAAAWLDDLVLLYVSGHGIRDDFGQLHLAMTNSRHDRLNATAVSAQFVRNQMDNTRSRRVVVVLDCCFAGAFPPGSTHRAGESVGVLSQLGGRGSAVMTSSSALEYSFESGVTDPTVLGTARPSVFTGALVEGLRTGGADRNGDGLIDVDELYDFIYEHVEAAGKPQTPGLDSQFQGRLIVAASAAATDLPPEFAQALRSTLPAVRLAVVGELSELLRADGTGSSGAARTALRGLAADDVGFVATAARAALERVGSGASPTVKTVVRSDIAVEDPAPERTSRRHEARPPIGGPAHPAASGSHPGGPARVAGNPPRKRGRRARRVVGLGVIAFAAYFVISHLPGGGDVAPPEPTTGEAPALEAFAPLPKRPEPLPDKVTCEYRGNRDTPTGTVTAPDSGQVPAKGLVRATISTNTGAIQVLLDRSLAPCAVNEFVHLAEQGFYNGSSCGNNLHAVVLSCRPRGDASGDGWTDETFSLPRHLRGYLTMPESSYPSVTLRFANGQPTSASTVLGTLSLNGMKTFESKRREIAELTTGVPDAVVINGVDVQD
ncbi:caspase family protein [Saccharopolyspora sp. NFXS83]|uniref:caspase, EACC1-associated type n=1 Tax=Saccharopolyspora sp. NFXS83 TaxID=2993560 RepID=UPI00224B147A|nr:caspase family protein [Saccharopolyspora sp. NFXS83]MCX2730775.1 caspase family protein [Saccharopolyspora sp. NFXS83]